MFGELFNISANLRVAATSSERLKTGANESWRMLNPDRAEFFALPGIYLGQTSP
jgi:hypothetical protein